MRDLIATLLLLVVPVSASADQKSPEEVYAEKVERARAEYRIEIAERVLRAKRVEVVLVSFDELRKVDLLEDDEERFPVAPYGATTRVISKRVLNPSESRELLVPLADQIKKAVHTGGSLCHYPVHGVRIYSVEPSGMPFDNNPICVSTFCWVCNNFGFNYPDGAEWLDTNSDLKDIFNKLMPVSDAELQRFEKKHLDGPKGCAGPAILTEPK